MSDLLSALIGRALADATDIRLNLPTTITLSGETGFAKLWNDVSGLVFAFLGVMAFAGIVYSGVMIVTAGGDATKAAAGRKNLIWSVIGIIVVVLAYSIIKFVFSLVGAAVK